MASDPRLDRYGYGLSAYPDIRRSFNKSYGIQRLREAIIARLFDSYWWSPTFGVQLHQRLARTNPVTWPQIAAECEAEIIKDERIASVIVGITGDEASGVTVTVNAVASEGEEFSVIGTIDIVNGKIGFNR